MVEQVDCVIHTIHLKRLSSKTKNSPEKWNILCITDRNWTLLIVVILIDRLMCVYYQQISYCCRPTLMTDRLTPFFADQVLIMYGTIAATSFSLLQQLCRVDNGILYDRCERLFVTGLTITILPYKYFTRHFWVAKSYMAVCFNFFWNTVIFGL